MSPRTRSNKKSNSKRARVGSKLVAERNRGSSSRGRKRIEAGLALDLARNERKQMTYVSQYRSNLSATISFFEGVFFRHEHIECLRRTPFYNLVLPFVKHKIKSTQVMVTQNGIVEVLMTYSKSERAFNLGGRNLRITRQDCELIFRIQSGRRKIYSERSHRPPGGLANRHFEGSDRVKIQSLKPAMIRCMESDTQQAVEDVVKIIVLHLMSSLFFIGSNKEYVNWWMFKYCENINNMSNYDWSGGIIDFLMTSIHTHHAAKVYGCMPLIMFWLFEHTTLMTPVVSDAFPRFRKWDVQDFVDFIKRRAIMDLNMSDMKANVVSPTEMERSIMNGEQVLPYISDDEHDVPEEVYAHDIRAVSNAENEDDDFANENYRNVINDDDVPIAELMGKMNGKHASSSKTVKDGRSLKKKVASLEADVAENAEIAEVQCNEIERLRTTLGTMVPAVEAVELKEKIKCLEADKEKQKMQLLELQHLVSDLESRFGNYGFSRRNGRIERKN